MKCGMNLSGLLRLSIAAKLKKRKSFHKMLAGIVIVLNVFLVYSAQDSAVTTKKSVIFAGNTNIDSPSTSSIKSKKSASQIKDSSTSVSHKDTTLQPAKIAVEKKLILEEEEMLIDESEERKTAEKEAATAKQAADTAQTDAVSGIIEEIPAADSQSIDTSKNAQKPAIANTPVPPDSTSQAKATAKVEKTSQPVKPVTVENVHSINFAKNFKDYKSPKMAMLLSLLIPGLGQAYVKQYYKSVIFVAIEATAIGFSVAFNNKGKHQYDNAKAFANSNYDYDKMVNYYNKLYDFFKLQEGSDSIAQEDINSIYSDSLNSFIKSKSDYYTTIESNSFVQGWKDCEPSDFLGSTSDTINGGNYRYILDSSGYLVYQINSSTGEIDTNNPLYGYSANQQKFSSMMSKSNDYYKTAQAILFAMVINHVISSVDALISAKAYNDALLGKESFWQHFSVEQQFVKSGSSNVVGCAMRIKF